MSMRRLGDVAPRRRSWERRVIVHAAIGHPVDAVFAYLADPMRWHEFAPAVAFREPIDRGPVRIGSRWKSTDRIGPFRIHFVDELAGLEPNRRVVWLSSAPWNARVEYRCSPEGAGTRIQATYEGRLSGSLRWQLGWVPSWAMHLILAQDFRRLERLLSRRAAEHRRWRERHPAPSTRMTNDAPMLHERSRMEGA
jgi:hypothetical protein